jgi:hypothetical protein
MDILIVVSFLIEVAESELWFQMHQINPVNQPTLLKKYNLTVDDFEN